MKDGIFSVHITSTRGDRVLGIYPSEKSALRSIARALGYSVRPACDRSELEDFVEQNGVANSVLLCITTVGSRDKHILDLFHLRLGARVHEIRTRS